MSKGLGSVQKKVLLLLMAGVSLGFTRSPGRYFKILKTTSQAWREINKSTLANSIQRLYESQLVDYKEIKDGTITIVLTRRGKKRARPITFKLDEMKIKSTKKWDRKWRMIIFDIPEDLKQAREDFRLRLRQVGLHPLQRSVFVHPFPCDDEIDFLIEFFGIRRFVRKIEVEKIDNDLHLRSIFSHLLK